MTEGIIKVRKYDRDSYIHEGNYLTSFDNRFYDRSFTLDNNFEWNIKNVKGYAKETSYQGEEFVSLQEFWDYT